MLVCFLDFGFSVFSVVGSFLTRGALGVHDEKLSALISTALIESSKCSITVLLHEFEFISSLLGGLNSLLIVPDSVGSILDSIFGTFSEVFNNSQLRTVI